MERACKVLRLTPQAAAHHTAAALSWLERTACVASAAPAAAPGTGRAPGSADGAGGSAGGGSSSARRAGALKRALSWKGAAAAACQVAMTAPESPRSCTRRRVLDQAILAMYTAIDLPSSRQGATCSQAETHALRLGMGHPPLGSGQSISHTKSISHGMRESSNNLL